jgi:hypothetical protein
MNFEVAE